MITLTITNVGQEVEFTIVNDLVDLDKVNTVYAGRWDGCNGVQDWTPVGEIIGNSGNIKVELPWGAYFCVVTDSLGQVSQPNLYSVFNRDLAFFSRIEAAVADTIKMLDLPGVTLPDVGEQPGVGNRVYSQLTPHDNFAEYPCVFVTSDEGVESSDSGKTNMTADIGHPVKVIMAYSPADVAEEYLRPMFWRWRQSVWAAFHCQRLLGVPEVKMCTVEFNPSMRIQLFSYPSNQGSQNAYQFIGTVLTIRCSTRQLMGFGN